MMRADAWNRQRSERGISISVPFSNTPEEGVLPRLLEKGIQCEEEKREADVLSVDDTCKVLVGD